ncbi:MAG TPA: monovalent cation/H(+) antiporter subunit G [Mycobacteriales bacterium]|nr:monovalent cation/H(+) antiporter subunit G [Mycobacteriales bacterium]
MSPLDLVGGLLVGLGVTLVAAAGLGLLRLPDAYTRMSAVTKAASLGVVLTLLGALALAPSWNNALKVLLAVLLQLATAPAGGFAIGRAAYRARSPLTPETGYDELADAGPEAGPR